MLDPVILARIRSWADLQNAIASLWIFETNVGGSISVAVELRPTRRKHDWAFAEWVAYNDQWRVDLSRLTRTQVRLVAFRDASDRPFDPADAQLIWERTKVIGEK